MIYLNIMTENLLPNQENIESQIEQLLIQAGELLNELPEPSEE